MTRVVLLTTFQLKNEYYNIILQKTVRWAMVVLYFSLFFEANVIHA